MFTLSLVSLDAPLMRGVLGFYMYVLSVPFGRFPWSEAFFD